VLSKILIGLIRFYQVAISPWTPAACRFTPTCSAYAMESIERHGVRRGVRLTARRVGRCHPWGGSGYDPVPLHDSEVAGTVAESVAAAVDAPQGSR
jgi:putative membrane protein insertion efficiency factor